MPISFSAHFCKLPLVTIICLPDLELFLPWEEEEELFEEFEDFALSVDPAPAMT